MLFSSKAKLLCLFAVTRNSCLRTGVALLRCDRCRSDCSCRRCFRTHGRHCFGLHRNSGTASHWQSRRFPEHIDHEQAAHRRLSGRRTDSQWIARERTGCSERTVTGCLRRALIYISVQWARDAFEYRTSARTVHTAMRFPHRPVLDFPVCRSRRSCRFRRKGC